MVPDRRSSNGHGLVVLLTGAALVLVSLQLVGCGSPDRPQETQRGASATPDSFSRSDWLAHPDSRHQLAEGLLAAGTLTAMSRDRVLRSTRYGPGRTTAPLHVSPIAPTAIAPTAELRL